MNIKQKKYFLIPLLLLSFITLAVFFGIADLWISQQIVDQENVFAQTMEIAGLLVAPYLAALSGFTLIAYAWKSPGVSRRWLILTVGALFCAGGLVYAGYVYFKMPVAMRIILSLATVGLLILYGWLLSRVKPDQLYKLMHMAAITLLYLAAVLLLIGLLKALWGRVRYRDMQDAAEFSRWFLPRGLTGNYSFPSGHTANASTLYALVLLVPLCKKTWQKLLCYLIPILWIVLMAVSRVIAGAHYASDVLFGAALSIAVFYLVRFLCQRVVEKK